MIMGGWRRCKQGTRLIGPFAPTSTRVAQQARDCGVSMPRRRLSQLGGAAAGIAAIPRQLGAAEQGMAMTTGAAFSPSLCATRWPRRLGPAPAGGTRAARPGRAGRGAGAATGGEQDTRLRLAGCSSSCGGVTVVTSGGRSSLLLLLLLLQRAGAGCAGCSELCLAAAAAAAAASAAETTAGAALGSTLRMKMALSLASTPPQVVGTATLSWGRPRWTSSSLDRPAEKLCCRQATAPSRAAAAHWKASWRSRSMKYTAAGESEATRRG